MDKKMDEISVKVDKLLQEWTESREEPRGFQCFLKHGPLIVSCLSLIVAIVAIVMGWVKKT